METATVTQLIITIAKAKVKRLLRDRYHPMILKQTLLYFKLYMLCMYLCFKLTKDDNTAING